jgi:hypothetical protein
MVTKDEARGDRIAGWCGIVFSVLSVIVVPLTLVPPTPLPPVLGARGAEIASWYRLHRVGFLVGNYLGLLAFVPGFVQLVALSARIERAEGGRGFTAALVRATGTFAYAVLACSLVVFQLMPFLLERRLEGGAETMGTLASIWFALDGLAALPLVVAVAWAAARTGALPRWFGRASWVVAALAVLMSLGGLTAKPFWLAGGGLMTMLGFGAFFAWTFALGVIWLRSARG